MESVTSLARELESLRQLVARKDQAILQLQEQVDYLTSRLFGRRSERIDPNQLLLFEEEPEAPSRAEKEEPEYEEIASHKRRRKGHGRQPFPAHLPRHEIHCDLDDAEKQCTICQSELKHIGDDVVERGHLVPSQWIVNRYTKAKYACPKGHEVKTAQAPSAVMDRCKYEPSVYAAVAVSKFEDHQPLERQESIFKRHGFRLPASMMGDMIQRVAECVVEPIFKQMKKELIAEKLIQADETPITLLQPGRKGSRTGQVFVYRSGRKILFEFREDRRGDGPRIFLEAFKGVLQSDGASIYNSIVARNNLIRAGCWSHARRKFVEASDRDREHVVPVLRAIQRLFRIESVLKKRRDRLGLSDEAFYELRGKVRQRRSTVVIEAIKAVLLELELSGKILPQARTGKALTYAINQWPTLVAFLEHPELEIDNNAAERAIRPVALGRKNYMFFGSRKGGRAAAQLYSLTATCRELGVNTQAYLEDVITKVSTTPQTEAWRLTPWAWAEAREKSAGN